MDLMKKKMKVWFLRYLPAEILGTLSAIIFPTVISLVTRNIFIIALAGTWGENIGFYGTMIVREVTQTRKKYRGLNRKYNWRAFAKDTRNIFLEFGVSETADSLFIRPATMYFGLSLFQNIQSGIFVGKIIADLLFYLSTIISYELRKKYFVD